ncbi:phosphate acetyltransferase [Candidatus Saccharibacteria bacterium oral taxon 488]|jgi:phosphate acetyltransferase|nr:phosphate acetyltransferase [Candidatus Saccharibacteria bacterium oral taxon 488]QJU08505.1 phosphate acetyltransferase [Candidatus Saccharibacteria bacterium oral taxon 488]
MNQHIRDLAKILASNPPRVVFPEGDNHIIQQAARVLEESGAAQPVLLDGEENAISRGATMLTSGEADVMVAGIDHPTKDVLRAGLKIVGLAPDVRYASSFFVIDVPQFQGGEQGLLLFADCGMNIQPNAEQLAAIAMSSANSAASLGWEPRVAMLSYSTKGSAGGDSVELVTQALQLVKTGRPDILIDGELQLDAAIVPAIGQKKSPDSPVAGMANILVFPDLGSGNIAYKLAEHLAGGHAYGPILQGFARPISDLSRGSSVDDVIGATLVTASMAQAHS